MSFRIYTNRRQLLSRVIGNWMNAVMKSQEKKFTELSDEDLKQASGGCYDLILSQEMDTGIIGVAALKR